MSGVSAALQAYTAAAMPDDPTLFSPRRFNLGNLTYAIVQISRGEIVVTMREYFQRRPEFRRGPPDDDFDDLLPGKRCLKLSAAQWYALEENSQKIDTVLEAVTEKTDFLTDKLLNNIVGCDV
ncbi:Transcriptional coactivator [Branchiostoma belcheri]|nr:Transcriptional coactivator [Branchiostoma belcheri]